MLVEAAEAEGWAFRVDSGAVEGWLGCWFRGIWSMSRAVRSIWYRCRYDFGRGENQVEASLTEDIDVGLRLLTSERGSADDAGMWY